MKYFIFLVLTALLTACAQFPSKERSVASERSLPKLTVAKNQYIGDKIFDVEITLSDTNGVKQIILDNKDHDTWACYPRLPKVVLSGSNLVLKKKVKMQENQGNVCDDQRDVIDYDSVIVEFEDGRIEHLKPFNYKFSKGLLTAHIEQREMKTIKLEEKLIDEEEGKENKLVTKKMLYELGYNVSASDLSDFRGVIFANGEELISNDSQELADFINSRKHHFRVDKIQDTKVQHWFCYPGDCLLTTAKPIKNKFKDSKKNTVSVTLIKKGGISVFVEEQKDL